ncbi:MAG: alpha/beta hydrolase [Verrucomicrobiota bacterium]
MSPFSASLRSGTTHPSPLIHPYFPNEATSNQSALIILAGGAYRIRSSHEGEGYAEAFAKEGFTCFVVDYRLGSEGHCHPEMLEDALASIETIRSRASEFKIQAHKIGIIGSSAGGHLASHLLTGFDSYQTENCQVSLRPDFGVLCYPVISSEKRYVHQESMEYVVGPSPSAERRALFSRDLHVNESTPPCFIWHTVEDETVPVENSLLFANALRKHRVPFEMHLYETGGHGLGLNIEHGWFSDCLRWIRYTLDLN